jgi:hypothetical protein
VRTREIQDALESGDGLGEAKRAQTYRSPAVEASPPVRSC